MKKTLQCFWRENSNRLTTKAKLFNTIALKLKWFEKHFKWINYFGAKIKKKWDEMWLTLKWIFFIISEWLKGSKLTDLYRWSRSDERTAFSSFQTLCHGSNVDVNAKGLFKRFFGTYYKMGQKLDFCPKTQFWWKIQFWLWLSERSEQNHSLLW